MRNKLAFFIAGALSLGLLQVASAADMPVKAAKVVDPAPYSWTGFYIGVNAGGKWARTSGSVDIAPSVAAALPTGASESLDSATAGTFIGGGQIGYNWQKGHMVYGIEGDFDFQHWKTTRLQTAFNVGTIFVPGDSYSVESRWQASLRGRLGYAWDRYLVYATGGVAFTDVRAESNWVFFAPDPASSGSSTAVLVGGTVGGGVAYAFWNNVSLGIEGRYTWYGSHTFDTGVVALAAPPVFTSTSQTIRLSTGEVLAKLNWKF